MKNYQNNNFDSYRVADCFDELPLWSAPFGLKLLDAIKYKTEMKVLDIGFGTGFPLTELAMRLGNTSIVYGIDLWKEAAERAQKKIDFYEIKNTLLIDGSAESIPLEDETIDLITSNNGINNIHDTNKAFQ